MPSSASDDDGVRRDICRLDAEQQRRHQTRQPDRQSQPDRGAGEHRPQALREHEAQQSSVLRTQRQPHAHLRRPPRNRVREHAVNARPAPAPARARQTSRASSIVKRRVATERATMSSNVRMPEIGRFGSTLATTVRTAGIASSGSPFRVHHELQRRRRERAVGREVDRERRIGLEAALAHVADDADDFGAVVALPFPEDRRLADRILARPQQIGEALADDHAPRLADEILLREAAPGEERQADRA